MKILKTLALALCLALSFSNYSNADVVTVPIGNGLSVNVTTGNNTQALQYINTNAAATQVNLGDDGNTSVPLQFQFSYFGKTFGTSWMHSNGVVSFQNPSATGNFCCAGTNLSQTTDSRYNYAIMPLWTDLYGRTGRNTYYLSTADSITYGWYGTSQYGNGNNKSSFEVKLDSAGAVDMRWSNAVIAGATVTMGFTGDLSKGQYYQYYNGNNINVNSVGVTYNGVKTPDATPTTPAAAAVVYTPTATVAVTSVDTSSVPSTAVSVGGVQLSTTGEITPPDNIPQVLKDSVAAVSSSAVASVATTSATVDAAAKPESNKAGPSAAVMNAVKQIQAADKAVQARAVQNANQQIAASSSRAQEQAMAVVDTANALSASSSQSSAQASSQSGTVSIMQAPQQAQTQSSQSSSQSSVQLAMIAPQVTQQLIQSTMQMPTVELANVQSTAPVGLPMLSFKSAVSINQNTTSQSDYSVYVQPLLNSKNLAMNEPIDFKLLLDTSINEARADTVNRNAQINDLAGAVDITAMATQPKGYEAYSLLTIKDAGFYAPKDIYGNQTTVDNVRALRQLGSDRLHQEMVDQQFRR